ncbi:MAG TPA: hypothetical protein VLB68_20825 [Pyrinomonadaceae bacterium]|nr:hypothetical protein [Pyrinomonadaceae bacterium]
MRQFRNSSDYNSIRFVVAWLAILFFSGAAFSQTPSTSVAGKYEGVAKVEGAADQKLTLDLKSDGGRISGQLVNGQTTSDVSEGTLVGDKLTLKLGAAGKDGIVTAKTDGSKLAGDWIVGPQKRAVELTKVEATANATTTAEVVNLSGQWDGVADAQGQPFPFLLVLKVEGETVTGSSSSQLGESTIKDGTWKDGKLNFQLESPNGSILMSAVVIEGKLSGEFDYSGQAQGKWVAVKKN